MVQTGDPTGSGKGGQSLWGAPFADEIRSTLKVRFTRLSGFLLLPYPFDARARCCLSPFSPISTPGASLVTVTRRHRYIRIIAAVRLSPSLTALFRYRTRDCTHCSRIFVISGIYTIGPYTIDWRSGQQHGGRIESRAELCFYALAE